MASVLCVSKRLPLSFGVPLVPHQTSTKVSRAHGNFTLTISLGFVYHTRWVYSLWSTAHFGGGCDVLRV